MNPFKVGDRVRKVSGELAPYEGTVDSIKGEYIGGSDAKGAVCRGYFGSHYRNYELISRPGEDNDVLTDDLDELIRKANEGKEALRKLEGHIDELEISSHTNPVGMGYVAVMAPNEIHYGDFRLRRKPKSAFEPFTVGDNWHVRMRGDHIDVGCKRFDAKQLEIALSYLCGDYVTFQSVSQHQLKGSRKGVVCNDAYCITWEDAEKIRDAIRKAMAKPVANKEAA